MLGPIGCSGSCPQIIRARSCFSSGARACIWGVSVDQIMKKARNVGETVSLFSTSGGVSRGRPLRGKGILGGMVALRSAAKYRQRAGPALLLSISVGQD